MVEVTLENDEIRTREVQEEVGCLCMKIPLPTLGGKMF